MNKISIDRKAFVKLIEGEVVTIGTIALILRDIGLGKMKSIIAIEQQRQKAEADRNIMKKNNYKLFKKKK